jgi:negative regulator of sigma E activity
MDPRPPPRLEELLLRAFDGEATAEERAELLTFADAEPRLAALVELRAALREALAVPGPVDLAADVMALLDADAAWSPLGDALRDAVRPDDLPALPALVADRGLDIAGAVMAELEQQELSTFFDGELASDRSAVVATRLLRDPAARETLAAYAGLGEALREQANRPVDVWPAVAEGIGVAPDAVHGWDGLAEQVRNAFAALPEIDIAGAVMAALEPAKVRMPRWASLGGPLIGFAVAAALLFAVLPQMPAVGPSLTAGIAGSISDLRLAAVNDAQVEDISAPADVVVQVMQFEDGGPTFILVDEEPSGVPL